MKTSTAIIIAAVLVIGAILFFWFANKKEALTPPKVEPKEVESDLFDEYINQADEESGTV